MDGQQTPPRRNVLLLTGGSLTAALAGCLGGGSNGDGDSDGDGNENGNGNGNESENGEQNYPQTFTAESRGGFITIGQESEEAARDESLGFPPTEDVPDPLVVEAEVYADNTWESTNIEFPQLDLGELLPPEFDAYDISVEFTAPEGYSGTLDREAGLFTLEGALRLTVTLEDQTVEIEAMLNATTGESGALTGSYALDADPPTATVVENEYVIDDETEAPLLNDFLGLPAEDPIWMELELEFVE